MAQLLQEYVDSRGVAMSVDSEIGVLRGVKLIGLESRNGRRYRETALQLAAKLYEEAKVNVNHPKEGPLTPRDYQDRLGVIRNVELRKGEGLFGDLHFNPKHALAEQLLWDAENNPRNVGFSHNVLARLSREGQKAVVEEITKVQSVDLVADPATTQGLFEQASPELLDEPEARRTWDALTLATLELHRPDLFAEIQMQEAEQVRQQLAEAEALSTVAQKQQRVFKLLCEHHLAVASDQSTEKARDAQEVSPAFVEMLMRVEEDGQLETLIAERAELARTASHRRGMMAGYSQPFSREQTSVLGNQQPAFASAQDFAEMLKSSCN